MISNPKINTLVKHEVAKMNVTKESVSKKMLNIICLIAIPMIFLSGQSQIAGQSASDKLSPQVVGEKIKTLVSPSEKRNVLSGVILVNQGKRVLFRGEYGFANWGVSRQKWIFDPFWDRFDNKTHDGCTDQPTCQSWTFKA